MHSVSITGKLPDDWEGDIIQCLVEKGISVPMLIAPQESDGIFTAKMELKHHADILDIREAMQELGIEILEK